MVESSLVLWGDRIIAVSKGKPAEVEFDFDAVWRYRGGSPMIFKQRELTWLHVHPIGYGTQASTTDQNCAEGLKLAFGNLGWFGILCFNDVDPDCYSGEVAWYRLVNGKLTLEDRELGRGVNCQLSSKFEITDYFRKRIEIPSMLKALSVSR